MERLLDLDDKAIDRCRSAAGAIAEEVVQFARRRTTTSIERATLRLFGVEGVASDGVPLPNKVVDALCERGLLGRGVALPFAHAVMRFGDGSTETAREIAERGPDALEWPVNEDAAREVAMNLARAGMQRIHSSARRRQEFLDRLGMGDRPYLYIIVATGNIYEDVVQAKVAARAGGQIIAVIRSTVQSLLDYVPEGATTEGYGGTYATQENFRVMRRALDDCSEELGRYVMQCNYASGLCMPEMAVLGAIERLDVMLNDALYGILFRNINMQRTLTDQAFSRLVSAAGRIIINTGEDNYLTTADPLEAAHTVLASQFINYEIAMRCRMEPEYVGLGHAMQMDPFMEDMFLLEVAQARMVREIFLKCPVKYMPPTRHMTGNIFRGHVQDALFALASVMTEQSIHLVGILTEAMHTPHMHDRYLALEAARMVMTAAKHLGKEVIFRKQGLINRRANEVLLKAADMLEAIRSEGLFQAIAKGMFADTRRALDSGRGLEGVVEKADGYFNPFEDMLLQGEGHEED